MRLTGLHDGKACGTAEDAQDVNEGLYLHESGRSVFVNGSGWLLAADPYWCAVYKRSIWARGERRSDCKNLGVLQVP